MAPEKEDKSFGTLLRFYRERAISKRMGRTLSQDQLASEISTKTGLRISRNLVGYWENDKSFLDAQKDRFVLIAIMDVLHANGGIHSVDDANRLLEGGKYQALTPEEADTIKLKRTAPRPEAASGVDAPPGGKTPQAGVDNVPLPLPLLNALISFLGTIPDTALNGSAGTLLDKLLSEKFSRKPANGIELYSAQCGNTPIDLAQQRLLVSTSFGAYFTGLLEQDDIYLDLETQIDCPAMKGQEGLPPLQRLFWLLAYPNGPRTVIIGGEGGMGKSTLSAKIIRCLFQDRAVDLILGDSAKNEYMDPLTKEIIHFKPGYYDPLSFYGRMCNQLGLPALPKGQVIDAIKDRLLGRRAIIIVDNLETVKGHDEILDSLTEITSRDVRAIVTTRHVKGIRMLGNRQFVVQMQPLIDAHAAKEFLVWHIERYQHQHLALQGLQKEIYQSENIGWLVERTGGIPLLMQLVLSDVAKHSWKFVQTLPSLFGQELLDFLYQSRWDDLGSKKDEGETAKQLLTWIAQEQYRGQNITSLRISIWAEENGMAAHLPAALSLLYESFLVINRDLDQGNFSIYPSLAEFIGKQQV
jgi:hypothetical protein